MHEPVDPSAAAPAPGTAAAPSDADGTRDTGPGNGAPEDGGQAEIDRLRREVRDLRGKLLAHPLISQAQGLLQERYRLPDAQTAFELMKRCSQQHNLKLRSLASAVVSVPRPDDERGPWFPGRAGRTPPPLPFLPGHRPDTVNRGTVLKRVLHQALVYTDAGMGDLQSAEPSTGLRMEHHHGLSREFRDFFALVDAENTTCALAARRQVSVTSDIATDPVFTEPARQMILSTGSRTAHSTPMVAASGRTVGVFSVHLPRARQTLTRSQTTALETMAAQAGRWLEWHRQTVLLNALEDLHHRGRALRADPSRRLTD
ncbi:ANTAR domain-containing protein [Streptomyces sp. NPDC059788]|uniref:ANTAR domain-containing protein n=1 Tax=Streptomyces sp. NPDC059788 TaxID=3346948 RepID=UPI00365EA5AF